MLFRVKLCSHLGRDFPVTIEIKLVEGFPVMLEVVRVELLVGGAVPQPRARPGHGESQQAADARGPRGDQAPVPARLTMGTSHQTSLVTKLTFASLSIICKTCNQRSSVLNY